jgi:hypothetical protein
VSITECVALLRERNVPLEKGFGADEIEAVERRFGFEFSVDHRALLQAVQPTGRGWINWRRDSAESLIDALNWPLDGVLSDVEKNDFWLGAWGKSRPVSLTGSPSRPIRSGAGPR